MATFFEHQDRARRNTRVLIVLMGLAVLAMGLSVFGLFLVLEHFGVGRMLRAEVAGVQPPPWRQHLIWTCLGGTATVVALASLSRMASLSGGGARVAEMLGGRLVSGSPRDVLEKRLLNVVEEMAIASGVPVPQVFVLDAEEGINAFAAGFALDDAAVAVTRGCLEKLTREELQGVIAHEFSHVLNGDMKLNLRLMGIVFGIVCIGLFGRFLMRVAGNSSSSYSSRRSKSGGAAAGLFVLGLGIFLIGTIGEMFGKLIKAAVSRQREFLADASAVQFTRNPLGISGALAKIGGFSQGGKIRAPNAEEASHFFFGDIHSHVFAHSVFATHPPLIERIQRIDPSFRGEFPEVKAGISAENEAAIAALEAGASGFSGAGAFASAGAGAGGHAGATAMVAQVGTLEPAAIAESRRVLVQLPEKLRGAAQSPFSACAIVYAMLLSDNLDVRRAQQAKLDALSGSAMHAEALRFVHIVHALSRRDRLPLVELLAPALRELSRDQRAAFSRTVQALIDADQSVSLFEHVLGEALRARLSDKTPAKQARVRHRSLASLSRELQLLLSLLAHAGDFDGTSAAPAFAAGAARIAGAKITLLPASTKLVSALGPALAELSSLAPLHHASVIEACAHTIYADRRVTDDEHTLLRAICDALGAPMPVITDS